MVRSPKLEFWQNRRVFITGHTGFKGAWMTSILLNLGAKVRGFSLPIDDSNFLFIKIKKSIEENVESIYGDILNKKLLRKTVKEFQPEIIFHFAAQPIVGLSYLHPLKTWETNVFGTLNLMDCLSEIKNQCTLIVITTDKVYENKESFYGYRENDQLGGYDPYSASKAATEIAISSWRASFLNKNKGKYKLASVRAGNVIGGGDWAVNRIVPDVIKGIISAEKIKIRNFEFTRPWQHVLEPLNGYLFVAEEISSNNSEDLYSFNFGPNISSNKSVKDLVDKIFSIWPGQSINVQSSNKFHETKLLNLNIEKSFKLLGWYPRLDFDKTVRKTVNWYRDVHQGADAFEKVLEDIRNYEINDK